MNTKYTIGLLIGIIVIIGIIGAYSYKLEVNTADLTKNNTTTPQPDNNTTENKNTTSKTTTIKTTTNNSSNTSKSSEFYEGQKCPRCHDTEFGYMHYNHGGQMHDGDYWACDYCHYGCHLCNYIPTCSECGVTAKTINSDDWAEPGLCKKCYEKLYGDD